MNLCRVKSIIFRYLTSADFFNIYKPSGTEIGGGGQAYIDFPIALVSLRDWGRFFGESQSVYCDTGEKGPIWEFPINSIGLSEEQEIKIYQRRLQSVCIASQRITSQRENRINAWRPEYGFPSPKDPTLRNEIPKNLLIFIIRTTKDDYWAGWSLNFLSDSDDSLKKLLERMINKDSIEGYAGFLELNGEVSLNPNNITNPFTV
jgi:5-methylcytosine-specific restriction protein A